MGNTLHNSLSS